MAPFKSPAPIIPLNLINFISRESDNSLINCIRALTCLFSSIDGGVGSYVTQPVPGKYASTHAWAFFLPYDIISANPVIFFGNKAVYIPGWDPVEAEKQGHGCGKEFAVAFF